MITVTLYDRNPAAAGPPGLVEVGPLVAASGFTLTQRLNQPDQVRLTIPSGKQESAVVQRFADLRDAIEIKVEDDSLTGSRVLFVGPVLGYQPKLAGQEITWDITAAGIEDYFRRWRHQPTDADLVYTGVDQALIAKGLIDYYQALSYGSVGVDTSGVVATGVTRDRTYVAKEAGLIGQRLSELAAVENGFDFWIDPATRALEIGYPRRGIDRTATVTIDRSSIVDPSAQLSVGPEDLISDAFAVDSQTGLVGHAFDATLRSRFGRMSFATGFSGITEQATIDAHAGRVLDQRLTYLHVPASKTFPIGFDESDFGVGDTVEYAYDYGAGLVVEARRVTAKSLSVDNNGAVSVEVGLE